MHRGVRELQRLVEAGHEADGGLRNVVVECGVVLAAALAVAIEIDAAFGIEVDVVLPAAGFELAVDERFAGFTGSVEIELVAGGAIGGEIRQSDGRRAGWLNPDLS